MGIHPTKNLHSKGNQHQNEEATYLIEGKKIHINGQSVGIDIFPRRCTVNRHTNGGSTSQRLITSEMQVQTTVRNYLTAVRRAITNKTRNNKCC